MAGLGISSCRGKPRKGASSYGDFANIVVVRLKHGIETTPEQPRPLVSVARARMIL